MKNLAAAFLAFLIFVVFMQMGVLGLRLTSIQKQLNHIQEEINAIPRAN